MTKTAAQSLALFIRAEVDCDVYVSEHPLERGYVVAIERDDRLILLRSWADWHARKSEIIGRESGVLV